MTKQDLEKEIAEAMEDSLNYPEGTYISVLYTPKEDTFMQRVDSGNTRYTNCITISSIEGKNLSWLDYLDTDVITETQLLLENNASWIDYPAHIVKKANSYIKAIGLDIENMDDCDAEEIMQESCAADFILQEYKKEWMNSEDWQKDIESYVDYALETLEDTIGNIDELQQIQKDLTIKADDYRERLLNTLNDNLKMVSLKPIPVKKYKDEIEVLNTIKELNANNDVEKFLKDYNQKHILSGDGVVCVDLVKDKDDNYWNTTYYNDTDDDDYIYNDDITFLDVDVAVSINYILATDDILYKPTLQECKEYQEK